MVKSWVYVLPLRDTLSVVTKAVYPETEAPEFEVVTVAFETEAVDPETEAARQYVNKQVTCEQ